MHVDPNSEESWLFVKVVNEIATIEDATTVADQMTAIGWTKVDGTENIYSYKEKVKADEDIVVFNSFKIKGDADVAAYAPTTTKDAEGKEVTTYKTIKVTAYAIQADGFTNAKAAWDAAGLE